MKTYELNGRLYKFADDKVPEGAVLHTKAKAPEKKAETVKAEETKPEKVETKAKKAPANKSRKAGANK